MDSCTLPRLLTNDTHTLARALEPLHETLRMEPVMTRCTLQIWHLMCLDAYDRIAHWARLNSLEIFINLFVSTVAMHRGCYRLDY